MTIDEALAASRREATAGERRQLAIMQTGVALDALRAGDLGAAAIFLDDACEHLKAAREAADRIHVVGSLDGISGSR